MPLSAPVETLTSSLSHIVPTMLSLTRQTSPARSNSARIASARALIEPSSSPIRVSLPAVPALTRPGASITPPT